MFLTWYADQKADEYQIRVTDGEYTYRYYYNAERARDRLSVHSQLKL